MEIESFITLTPVRTAHQLTSNSGAESDRAGRGKIPRLENNRLGVVEEVLVRVTRHHPGHRPEQKDEKISEHFVRK